MCSEPRRARVAEILYDLPALQKPLLQSTEKSMKSNVFDSPTPSENGAPSPLPAIDATIDAPLPKLPVSVSVTEELS